METGTGVNALTIVFAALCIFAIAYRFYGLFIATKVLSLNEARKTPAVKYSDGQDYVPTNKYVLFGTISQPLRQPARFSAQFSQRSSATCRACSGF